jgi:Flp pilus assembly protein TadB
MVVGAALAAVTVLLAGAMLTPVAVCLPLAGLALPDLCLASAARRAEAELLADLPASLDMLAAALTGGVPLQPALDQVASDAAAPLSAVLRRVRGLIAAGRPVAAAFHEEAERSGVDGLVTVATLIERHHTLGVPVAPVLHRFAEDARSRASAAAVARAGRAIPIAGLLTALVIAPACVIALIVCLVGGLVARGGIW